jgi:hypothetical protein
MPPKKARKPRVVLEEKGFINEKVKERGLAIISVAKNLRLKYPKIYGVKGADPKDPDYVKGGWHAAMKKASESYREHFGTTQRPKKPRKMYNLVNAKHVSKEIYRLGQSYDGKKSRKILNQAHSLIRDLITVKSG